MSMKLAFLLPALFLAFPHGHAGAAPFEPSVLEALQPPAEHGAFHSGWISLGLKAAALKEKQVSPGHITDVGEAQMQLYFPAGWKPQDRRAALCIFPGGGYALQAIEKEGGHIARWAAEHGMVGVVVKYRVSGSNDAVGRFPGPLLDARQALRVTRRHASALGVDPHRIGVMGFSAGGHLAAMASTLWNRPLPEEAENPLKSVSARPDFSLLIYPVITMDPKNHPRGHPQQDSGACPRRGSGGAVFRGTAGDAADAARVPRPRAGRRRSQRQQQTDGTGMPGKGRARQPSFLLRGRTRLRHGETRAAHGRMAGGRGGMAL